MDIDDPRVLFRLRDLQEKVRRQSRVVEDEFPIFFGEADP